MNRHKLSSSVSYARNNFLEKLLNHTALPDLGFTAKEFPPEKTIYYALLKNTGIHQEGKFGQYFLTEPTDKKSFKALWEVSNQFSESASVSKRTLEEYINILSRPPFKLKKGFIEYWLPIFLLAKKEDYAFYRDDTYIPFFSKDILEVLAKDAHRYSIKTFQVEGIKLELFNAYRQLIQQENNVEVKESSLLQTIRPFIQFYRQLPQYSKLTDRVSNDAKAFRQSINNAKDVEQVFFEDLLTNFGVSLKKLEKDEALLSEYVKRLRNAMRELSAAYSNLLERFEKSITNVLGIEEQQFNIYKEKIYKRYNTLNPYILMPKQKVLRARLISPIPNREKYLSSLSTALVGKKLTDILDSDEPLIYKRLKQGLNELDNLIEISNLELGEKEEAVKVEITALNHETIRRQYILSQEESAAVEKLENTLREILDAEDKNLMQLVLLKLLEEQIDGTKKS